MAEPSPSRLRAAREANGCSALEHLPDIHGRNLAFVPSFRAHGHSGDGAGVHERRGHHDPVSLIPVWIVLRPSIRSKREEAFVEEGG